MKIIMNYSIILILFVLGILLFSCENEADFIIDPIGDAPLPIVDTFTFSVNGMETKGKIFVPAAYKTDKNLPAIFLIDFTEQHFKLATDEFERVIDGVKQIEGFDALIVSLENIPDVDAHPSAFQEHFDIYTSMASYIDGRYTHNSSRTFIGKGSESSIVLMALFIEDAENSVFDNFIATDPSPEFYFSITSIIANDDFQQNKSNKKLHFSFSTSNDRAKCNKLIDLINEAQYPWLQFESIEYTNSNYENTYPVAYAAGLKFIFGE